MQLTKSLRISPSSIITFFKCSKQYQWRYIEEREPDPGSDNLFAVLGSTLHKASELHDLYDVTLEDLKKSWRILFLNYLSETKYLEPDTQYDYFLSRGYDLLTNLFELKKRWKGKAKVIAVERYVRIPYKNKFIDNVYLSGKIDVILKNLDNLILTALDWKSAKRPKSQEQVDEDLQLSFYVYFIHVLYEIPYDEIFATLAYPSCTQLVFTQRDEESLKTLMFDKIDLMLEKISSGDFKKEPKSEESVDNCTFCPYIISCDRMKD